MSITSSVDVRTQVWVLAWVVARTLCRPGGERGACGYKMTHECGHREDEQISDASGRRGPQAQGDGRYLGLTILPTSSNVQPSSLPIRPPSNKIPSSCPRLLAKNASSDLVVYGPVQPAWTMHAFSRRVAVLVGSRNEVIWWVWSR